MNENKLKNKVSTDTNKMKKIIIKKKNSNSSLLSST